MNSRRLLELILGLPLLDGVRAQCDGPSTTLSTAADASSLADCPTYTGSVIISGDATGSIPLNGIQKITGNLTCQNADQLIELSADQLTFIGGNFELINLTILSTVAFSSLTAVDSMYFEGLPALQGLDFNSGHQDIRQLLISNTQLNSLTGVNPQTIENLNINNNPYLTNLTLSALSSITGSFSIAANGEPLELFLPDLQAAYNVTIRNASVVSMSSLTTTNGSLGFYDGTMTSLDLSGLISTGGTFAVADCGSLQELNVDALSTIGGGFLFAASDQVDTITLPKLQVIVGALDFTGAFSSISIPDIKDIRGGANVQTASSTFNCTHLTALRNEGVIKGVFVCSTVPGASTDPNAISSSSSNSPTSSATASSSSTSSAPNEALGPSPSPLSSGAFAGIAVGAVIVVVIAAALAYLLCIRPKRKSGTAIDPSRSGKHELAQGGHHEKAELPSDPNHVSELPGDRKHTLQRDQNKEVVQTKQSAVDSGNGRIQSPGELPWNNVDRWELEGDTGAAELTEENTIKRKTLPTTNASQSIE